LLFLHGNNFGKESKKILLDTNQKNNFVGTL